MKIGIYPGAFDPVHAGHVAFARAALRQFGLDKVYFLPEPKPRHKQGVKALEHRINMLHLVTAEVPEFGVISLQAQEFDVRYIWPAITSRFLGQELFMLLGNNAVRRIAAWPHTTEFGRQAPLFVVAQRGGKQSPEAIAETIQTKRLKLEFEVLDTVYPTYSAALIRRSLKNGDRPEEVSGAVFDYIRRNKLYSQ